MNAPYLAPSGGHLACPPSRRGHSWRELTGPERDAIAAMAKRSDALAARLCRACGAAGRVDHLGRIKPITDPADGAQRNA